MNGARSAADEVDDFEFVSGADAGGGPVVTADDGAVLLDGYAITFEFECGNEIRDSGGW